MIEMFWVMGIVGSIGLFLVIMDYRDHAKNKKAEKENKHESTFFKDVDKSE